MAVQDNMIPVFDPEHDALKAVPKDQAQHFAEMGYDVGDNAKNRALQNSPSAKLGAALTRFGDAGSFGLFNLGLAAAGRHDALKNAARAQEANPKSALAGTIGGVLGGTIAAPLALGGKAALGGAYAFDAGGLGAKALAATSEGGMLARLAGKGANVLAQGAVPLAVQGASDAVTQDALLNHPVTAEQLASSALGEVLWNAGFVGATHGVLALPKILRSGAGNLIDKLEHAGYLKAKMVKDLEGLAETGPKVTSRTQIFDREYAAGDEPSVQNVSHGSSSSSPASPEPGLPFEEPSLEQNLHLEGGPEVKQLTAGEKASAAATESALGNMPHDTPQTAGLPDEVVDSLQNKISAATPLESLPKVEPLSIKKARAASAKAAAEAEQFKKVTPEDVEPSFDWPKGYNQRQKLHVLRGYLNDVLERADPEAKSIWKRVQDLENESAKLTRDHKTLIKEGGEGITDYETQVQKLWAQKADLKNFLGELAPANIDHEAGSYSPGFNELNAEYARVVNPKGNLQDLERPAFTTKAARQSQMDEALHAKALKKAEAAEEHLRLTEEHHAEKQAQAEVIERNRVATADAAAAKKRIAADAKAETKAAKDTARAEEKAAKEKARADAKAEREADSAKAKSEKEAAQKAAKEARAEEQRARINAREASAKARAEMPRAGEAPKSAKTQSYQTEQNGPEGLRRETVTRKEANGRIKEKHRVVIKAPKVPPKMKFDGYEMPFSSNLITGVAGTGYFTGLGHITTPIAAAMTGVNAVAKLASHREAIGAAFQRVERGLAKTAPTLITAGRVARRNSQSTETAKNYDLKDYQHVVKSAAYLHANPDAVQGYMDTKYPNLAQMHPKVHHNATLGIMKALAAFHQRIPKTPYDPTLMPSDFTPTRAQQVEVMRNLSLLSNPALGLQYASPSTTSLMEESYPHILEDHRQDLIRQMQAQRTPLSSRSARQLSSYLGASVRPIDDAQTLKRLQETAGPEPMQKPQGNQAGGGASSKITTQAVQRDMPVDGLYQLGG